VIRANIEGRLTERQILDYIKEYDVSHFQSNNRYYEGSNPGILDRRPPDNESQTPDRKVPVPYARKIINTVTGYMYKPGLIKYTSENETYLDTYNEVMDQNHEPLKTSQIGKQASIQGVGYELHYVAGVDTGNADLPRMAVPRFVKVPAAQMIPLYNYELEPELIAAIRYFKLDSKRDRAEVYYPDVVQYYFLERDPQSESARLVPDFERRHYYDRVPIVVFRNNEEMVGDFEPVKYLIDAYDVLLSDSMNEFDRFAFAYLVLKGMQIDKDDVEDLRVKRVLEVMENGGVEFLTKDIPADFIGFMTSLIRKEIHKQTHVPDFLEGQTGDALSGVAISKLLYDFEFIAATKEAYFREGLADRARMIHTILKKRDNVDGDPEDIAVVMERNIPQMDKENAEVMGLYAGMGISNRTLIDQFAPFVENVDEEMQRYKEEQEEYIDLDNPEEGPAGSGQPGGPDDQGNRAADS
jgi:SPP1 family phage portal protein